MRPVLPPLLALVLGAACAALVACGSGGGDSDALIPATRADALQRELDQLDRAVRTGDCESVGGAVSRLQDEVNGLSNRVDAGLRERLNEGVANLADIAPEECLEAEEDQTETTTTTETTPVETTPTETVPPETTETEPPPVETTEPEPPPVETTDPEPPPVETIPPDDTGGATPEQPSDDPGDTGGASPTP